MSPLILVLRDVSLLVARVVSSTIDLVNSVSVLPFVSIDVLRLVPRDASLLVAL